MSITGKKHIERNERNSRVLIKRWDDCGNITVTEGKIIDRQRDFLKVKYDKRFLFWTRTTTEWMPMIGKDHSLSFLSLEEQKELP